MSLVGSLEDLGLGDILQIVSLARKSGRLMLRTDGDSGRIVLREGMVHGAVVKGEFEDLGSVLASSGDLSAEEFARARALAAERALSLDDALAESASLAPERLDAIRREFVERAVMRMFSWRSGEFSFEVREDPDPEDAELSIPVGINTQYLAMEATRQRDEDHLLGDALEIDAGADEEPLFSGEDAAQDAVASRPIPSVVDAMALASVRSVESVDEDEDTQTGIELHASPVAIEGEASPIAIEESQPVPEEVRVAVAASLPEAPAEARAETPRERPPLVAIDPDLIGLEWLKRAVGDDFPRVHIFQRDEAGMDRIRRYLARGVQPLVLAAPAVLDAIGGAEAWTARLRGLSADLSLLALRTPHQSESFPDLDGVVTRPTGLSPDPEQWGAQESMAEALREALRCALARTGGRGGSARPDAALEQLRSVSDRLRDPDRGDDVLALVLEFASRSLARVAMFMLRDETAVGLAQLGMPRADGPDDETLAGLEFRRDELPGLFHRALADRRGARGPLDAVADAGWVEGLGGSVPREAYVAPIESGGTAVALLYADNLPVDGPIGDTTALEIVLHEAGLALDRALLERALADARSSA